MVEIKPAKKEDKYLLEDKDYCLIKTIQELIVELIKLRRVLT